MQIRMQPAAVKANADEDFLVNHTISFRTLCPPFLLIVALLLVACSDKPSSLSDKTGQRGTYLEQDVGTDTSVVVPAEQVLAENSYSASSNTVSNPANKSSESFKVDQAAMRVYLPGSGWIASNEFWDIYMNNPEKLPSDLDHSLLDPIRPVEQ